MDREEIKTLLPHREPMLLVDEIELDGDGVAHGKYTVRGDEWFLKGHFPGSPVVPGVIQCEIMGQTCAALFGGMAAGRTPYYTGLDKVRFRSKVVPGDTMEITARADRVKEPFCFARATVRVGGRVCCEGELSFALMEEK